MHEMNMARSIYEAASGQARRYAGHRAAKVGVLIGEHAGVNAEALRFCFEAVTKDIEAPPALDISWRAGSQELRLTYLELEEVTDEQNSCCENSPVQERSDCGSAA